MRRSWMIAGCAVLALAACGEQRTTEATTAATNATTDTTAADPALGTGVANDLGTTDVTGAMTAGAATVAPSYVMAAAMSDMYEIRSSELAVTRATSPAVRDYAQMMIRDHTQTSGQMKPIASQLGITPPAQLDERRQELINSLQNAASAAFETLYLDQQQEAHREAIDLHQAYAENGDNAELRAFAQKVLPAIRGHLETAERLDAAGADSAGAGQGN